MNMSDDQPVPSGKLHRLGAALAISAIAAGGVVWSGCGDSDSNTVTDQARQEVEQGAKQAEEAVEEGAKEAEQGLEEAKKQLEQSEARKEAEKRLEEGQAKAEKGLEEAKENAEKYLR
jgi:ElaB/YqjD/DUF883 family membrane-anchored ribosome-binding protein